MSAASNPLTQTGEPITWNFKLLAQNDLGGFGGMGEGMAVQIAKDGRRIIWLAHESAPKNFTGVDVSDPRNPKVVVQTDLPQAHMRSNSLEMSGDILAVAYQTQKKGQQPAGFELFDVSVPEKPRSISFFDCSGATSRGVHQLWFCDGEYVHMASGAADFKPSNPHDDQFYRCIDVRNPSKPVEVGRWWMPGTREGDNVAPPPRHKLDKGYRAHNTNVYQQRPDRLYLAYIDGGMFVMDIADKAHPKVDLALDQFAALYRLHAHGDAAVRAQPGDRHRRVDREQRPRTGRSWCGSWTRATKPTWCRSPPARCRRSTPTRTAAGGSARTTCHENTPVPTAWHSDQIVLGTFFNGGLRAYDISNPYQPKEVGGLRAAGAEGLAGRRHPAQRRVRGRARDRLHHRSLQRRAVHAGDGFLDRGLSCPAKAGHPVLTAEDVADGAWPLSPTRCLLDRPLSRAMTA